MVALLLCFALIIFPDGALKGAGMGLSICLKAVVPSLLPFMLLSNIAVSTGGGEKLGKLLSPIFKPLLRIDENISVCFVTGLLGGYPCGGRLVGQMEKEGIISNSDAAKALAFCNNSGPLFIIGTVGAAVYSSTKIGLTLYGCHIVGAVAAALVFGWQINSANTALKSKSALSFSNSVGKAARESGEAILSVCALIITFSALIEALGLYRFPLLVGLIEVSRGAAELGSYGTAALPLAAAYISWGGLSVHFQTEAVTSGISKKYYYIGKIISALVSAAAMALCIKFFISA